MPIKLFNGLGSTGLVSDQPVTELPPGAWTDAINVRFENGAVRKMPGQSQYSLTATGTPMLVFQPPLSRIGYATEEGEVRFITSGGVDTDVTGTTLNLNSITGYTMDTLPGGVIVINGGIDPPVYSVAGYSGGMTTAADLPGWPTPITTCRIIRAYKSFLVALGIDDGLGDSRLEEILWSNRADPGLPPTSWDYTDTTQPTGRATLPLSGLIQDAQVLRDSLIIYQNDNIYALTEVGGVTIMSLRKLFSEVGAYAPNCVLPWRNQHVVLAENGVFIHDGSQIQSITEGRVRDAMFGDDFDAQFKPYLALNERHNEIWVCMPERGASELGATLAWIWNYQDNTWTRREIPLSYHGDIIDARVTIGSTNPQDEAALVIADKANDKFLLVDSTEQFDGTNMTCYAERRALPLGVHGGFDHRRMKFIRQVTPVITGTAGGVVNIYLGVRDTVDGTRTWKGPFPYTIGTSRKVDCRVSGRVIDIKFESTTNITWELHSYGIDYRLADARR